MLGRQLHDMADWSATLAKCGVAALAPEADALYKLGKDASDARDKAQSDNRFFRDVGARKQFVDTLNATRKETEGALAKLPFQDPSLPQDFSDSFFYSDPPRDDEPTIEEVKQSIKALETHLAEEKAQLAKMEQEAADAAKAAQEEKDKEAQAAALEAQAKALLEQAAALKQK